MMRYLPLYFFLLILSCDKPLKKNKALLHLETTEEEIKTEESLKTTHEEFAVVLKDLNNMVAAKSLIENSGLIWSTFLIDNTSLKVTLVKVPIGKRNFWIERLRASNLFSSVEMNTKKAIENIKYISKNTLIKLRKAHCSGDCSVYDVVFFKDGKVAFRGIESVLFLGKKEFTLSEVELKKVTNLFNKTTFKKYNTSFIDKTMADFPSTFISYNNKQVEIKLWKNVPDKLILAYEYLEEILLEKKLIE
ncbi:MAG: hypothetical protein ACJAQ1_000770 [Flavobacterium sp.]|jgi:hypothetical protein